MTHAGLIDRQDPVPGLLTFLRQWVPGLGLAHRVSPARIPEFVPPPLRAVYELTGGYPAPVSAEGIVKPHVLGLFHAQDCLIPFDRLAVEEDLLPFVVENQGVWRCETELDSPDPAVYLVTQSETLEICDSLAHFLTTFCLRELAFGARHVHYVNRPVPLADLVKGPLDALWIEGWYSEGGPTHSFYQCEESLLVMDGGEADLWLAANDAQGLARIAEGAPITRIR